MKRERFYEILGAAVKVALITWTAALCCGQSLSQFGYGRMTVRGVQALGARPLVVMLAQYDGYEPFARNAAYYDQLVFDTTKKSVNGYYLENSRGRFSWKRAGNGTYGPFQFAKSQFDGASSAPIPRLSLALQTLSQQLDFSQFDANGDGIVSEDELVVLLIENATADAGVNRPPTPSCFAAPGKTLTIQVCVGAVAMVGQHASFSTICHELSHRLGTIEMYGTSQRENIFYTLMGATIVGYDDQRTFHLDPWHKMLLGWTEPRLFQIEYDGSTNLGAAQLASGGEPVILYSPTLPYEFFMLEFRSATLPGGAGYDTDVPGTGLVIWHIKTLGKGGPDVNDDVQIIDSLQSPGNQMITACMLGAPALSRGFGGVWPQSASIPYSLSWFSEVDSGKQIHVGLIGSGGKTIFVSWGAYQSTPAPPSRKLLFYSSDRGSGATATIRAGSVIETLRNFIANSIGSWTHVAGDSSELVFYNNSTGALATGQIDAQGFFQMTRYFPPGQFSTGWTRVVRHKGYVLFYNGTTGAAAAGQFEGNIFHQYGSFNLLQGWSEIVSTSQGLFFYNASTGSASVGDWGYIRSGTGFGQITGLTFTILKPFGAGSFSTMWTHVVNTSNGLLFYSASSGRTVMADIGADGSIVTRANSEQLIRPNWTQIVADNDDILFYDRQTGDGAVGTILGYDLGPERFDQTNRKYAGSLIINVQMPHGFSPGWTQITTSVDPNVP